uniref:Uncharacterized protein n=1 Tax=Heterorhabditis bacteriophora TaxID=37862 RepID=A0A1I7WYI1_HETBA
MRWLIFKQLNFCDKNKFVKIVEKFKATFLYIFRLYLAKCSGGNVPFAMKECVIQKSIFS